MIQEGSKQALTISTQIRGDQEILVFHLQEVLVDQTSVLDLHQVVLEVVPEVLVLEVLEVVAARFNKCYKKF